jgi:hypothetical protein
MRCCQRRYGHTGCRSMALSRLHNLSLYSAKRQYCPWKSICQACRTARQNDLTAEEYMSMMMERLDRVPEDQFKAMMEIEKEKLQTAKAYNKKVKEKSFQVGNLV